MNVASIISAGLTVTQALQVITGLVASVKSAVEAGETKIPEEALRAHLGQLDTAIENLETKVNSTG